MNKNPYDVQAARAAAGAATPMVAVLRTAERQAGHMADMRAHSRIPAFRQRRTISTADATGRL